MTERHKINKMNETIEVEHLGPQQMGDGKWLQVWRVAFAEHETLLEMHLGDVEKAHGLTNEVLLAVVAERIAWQKGTDACRENAIALTKIEEALHWLGARAKRLGEAP